VPSERWGEEVKAVIVAKPGRVPQQDDIIRWARKRLAGFKVPKTVDVIEAFPRSATGKILKRKLREKYWKGYGRQVN
jgi:acyl-CoA synthetase (AMP-forming)/AMP-acid ligase II